MRKSIDTYVKSIVSDNKQFILEGGYESVADYIISNAENGNGYNEYFDDSELDESGEPTQEQIYELKNYLNDNYGLTYDSEHYFIDYRFIGSNLRPDVTIIERK